MKSNLSEEVLAALRVAERSSGWNNRSGDVRRFELDYYGQATTLYVVPFRRWAYRRQELQTAEYQREQRRGGRSKP